MAWLIEELHCALLTPEGDRPLCTKDGKSVLALACERRHADIVYKCVQSWGCSTSELTDLIVLQSILNVFINLVSANDVLAAKKLTPVPSPRKDDASELRARRQSEEVDDDSCCIVCYEHIIDCALIPCGHSCVCMACARGLRNYECPVCRVQFKQAVRIFHIHSRKPEASPRAESSSFVPDVTVTVPSDDRASVGSNETNEE
eukprot:c9712_g1_i2.p1 GENE.c9712_g1_i2~~c9712_g1_i2.p1  ORF type:complete len:203 (+),score=23.83 c9712_g1_i2:607-1215(+)